MSFKTGQMPTLQYRRDIDGLRAIAVLAVILYHYFPEFLPGGFIGVDIFFVISGYLIYRIILTELYNGSFSLLNFYSRRVRRLFPALLMVLGVVYLFGWFALFPDEFAQLGKYLVGSATFISNFISLKETGYFDSKAEIKPLLHLWSLAIEEQFYLILPLILLLLHKYKKPILLSLLAIATVSFTANIVITNTYPVVAFYHPISRFWELLLGCILAHILNNKKNIRFKKSIRSLCGTLGIMLIFVSMVLLNKSLLLPGYFVLLPVCGAIIVIFSGADAIPNKALLSQKILILIGLMSYPLYLWHWPIISYLNIIESRAPSSLYKLAAIAISFILSYLTYLYIERPVRFRNRTSYNYWWSGSVGTTTILTTLMFMIGIAGYFTRYSGGYPERNSIKAFILQKEQLLRTPGIDQSCKQYINDSSPLFPYCRFNDVGAQHTVAIIGDSHAHVMFSGLAEALAPQGKNLLLLANSACPPLIGSVTGDNPTQWQECADRINQILDIIISDQDIKDVLIATRGAIYITGNGFGEAEKDYYNKPILSFDGKKTNPMHLFKNGLQQTVNSFIKNKKNVYYIVENPEIGMDPSACLPRPFRSGENKNCTISKNIVESRQAEYRRLLREIINLKVIETLPMFCPNNSCIVMQNNKLLYADDDHLSTVGSKFLADYIMQNYLLG